MTTRFGRGTARAVAIFALPVLSLLLVAAPSRAQTTPAPAASAAPAAPQPDPKVANLAKDWFHRIQTNTVDRSQLTDQMSSLLAPALVQQLAAQLAPLGDPSSVTFVTSRDRDGLTMYKFLLTFKDSSLNEIIALDPTGKIAVLSFAPVQ